VTLRPAALTRLLLLLAVPVSLASCTGETAPGAAGTSATHAPHRALVRGAATSTRPPTSTTSAAEADGPPVTPLTWSPCNGDLQCASLVVPLNYADPGGPTIAIALERHPAEDPSARLGSLVINPGGPGVSGLDDMRNELAALTPQLLDDFDIVTFDPRGVERSDPVSCGETPGAPPPTLSDPVPTTPTAQTTTINGLRQYAAACEKASGTVLPYVGSIDVSRDLDRLRQALGDAGLTYMGQSYGTLLGLTYASLFPTHVRAMVLDSVIDPALSFNQITAGQAQGFEKELDAFFSWCASDAVCPWRPTGDPTSALLALIAASASSPVPAANGRVAGAGELYDALLDGLYARSDWPALGDALAADAAGQGGEVVTMSDRYNANGSTNGSDAGLAVDCLDHPVSHDLAAYGYLAAGLKTSAPVFGPLLAWGEAACAAWPVPPTRPVGPVSAAGSPPMLVVGTTSDPATPYAWAVSVAHELRHAVLLTRDGDDHVAYFYSSCVQGYVQSYLVSGITPPPGTTCTS
jgi:pimeloyl-ACP methyl ester carboxylesterase